ncbi:MAG: hypothetical protein A2Y57_00475 [Candidatus Woykebacteria bacterium RBG_13_40_7b]|uniref:DUF4064 domain-containing protein n=1 Tax=Candidatus Woykebacteria bacterium RBG_13_40_7b TaxID=1802594 RepID=A0A1G1WAI5_9BACT|nr:MAG: hypothetical protein A2Y57_00475 [Candidatus Woykebacteria bacterium RBG_13_40_7b]
MKGAVVALGIIGAIAGLIAGFFALGVQGVGDAFGAQGPDITGNGIVAILASVAGLIGTVLVFSKPKIAGGVMIGSGIVGLVATSLFYIIALIFLGIGGILALTIKQPAKAKESTSQ